MGRVICFLRKLLKQTQKNVSENQTEIEPQRLFLASSSWGVATGVCVCVCGGGGGHIPKSF